MAHVEQGLDHLEFDRPAEGADHAQDQLVGLPVHGLDGDVGAGQHRLVERADQGPDLVEDGRRFVEQLAQVRRFLVAPGVAKDVVHALGSLAIVRVVADVLSDLFF